MNISDDQNTITIDSNTYEAVINEDKFCRDTIKYYGSIRNKKSR